MKCLERKGLARDFSGLEAGSADILALGVTVNQGANALDIWIPTAAGTTVRVRDIITKAWSLVTDIAYSCHVRTPCFFTLTSGRKISRKGAVSANSEAIYAGEVE
jgi:hypothetical protein